MKILLIGGGSGGHITPLLAVALELKSLHPGIELIGVCEKNATFKYLFDECQYIDHVYEISAGKYRRYAGLKWYQRWFDVKTLLLNIRDIRRTISGYKQAKQLIGKLKPDAMLIKGGFVGVPMGKAGAKLKIPYLTHDSDSTPGLANRLISGQAIKHATGMPAELYNYPEGNTVYTGIPVSKSFQKVSPSMRHNFRKELGLGNCKQVVTIVGGSQGAGQLNTDMISISSRLMKQFTDLGIIHVSGKSHELETRDKYSQELSNEENKRVIVQGFVNNIYVSQGAADVVITRAGATQVAELSLQSLPIIIVPGQLAGAHQDKNAEYLNNHGAGLYVKHGDSEALYTAIENLLSTPDQAKIIGENLHKLAKPEAARELALLTLSIVK